MSLKKLIIFTSLFFISTFAFSKTVKVAYVSGSGDFMGGDIEGEPSFGYAYDYLQTISSYTGWKYEYVYGEWDDILEMFEKGEIDLLPEVSYTPERAKIMNYPDFKMGTENYYIYANQYSNTVIPGDYSAINGKTIGVERNTLQYKLLKDWVNNNGIDCKILDFSYSDDAENKFNAGEFDLYISIDIVASFFWEPICKIGESDIYLAVTKNRTDLLVELNNALNQLSMVQPYYTYQLWEKYFADITTSKRLTFEEETWLNLRDRHLKFGYLENNMPFSQKGRTGQCEGLLIDMFQSLKNSFAIDSVKVEFIPYKNYNALLTGLQNNEIQAAFPVAHDINTLEQYDLISSISILSAPMGYISYKGITPFNIKSVAVFPESDNMFYTDTNYPFYEKKFCYDVESCFAAVNEHKADCAFFNTYQIQAILNKGSKYKNIKALTIPDTMDYCFVLQRENYLFCSVLNKTVASIPQAEINIALEKYINTKNPYSLAQIIQYYLPVIVIVLMLILLLAISLLVTVDRLMDTINYDTLTHLLNRRRLDFYIKKSIKNYEENKIPFSIVLFDVDGFKKINDKYGHDCGDVVLKQIADIIRTSIKENDYAFRWGGEEFLLIINADHQSAKKTAERIRAKVEEFDILYNGIPVSATITAGCVEFTSDIDYHQMFIKADEKLYMGKESGKNIVIG